MLERQDLDIELEEKVDMDLTAVRTETRTDMAGEATFETRQRLACDQSKSSDSVPEAGVEDAVTKGDRSDWDQVSEADVESVSDCPKLESSVCQSNNTPSVICSVQGSNETVGDTATVCSAAEVRQEEVRGDNQSVTTATAGSQMAPTVAQHPRKVIVTNVTINSLTVTFKEARVAEGFFKSY